MEINLIRISEILKILTTLKNDKKRCKKSPTFTVYLYIKPCTKNKPHLSPGFNVVYHSLTLKSITILKN